MNGLTLKNRISSVKERLLLDAFDDEYGGVVVDHGRLPSNPTVFTSMLQSSLSDWRRKVKLVKKKPENLKPFSLKKSLSFNQFVKKYL